jgi:hypothetical protein
MSYSRITQARHQLLAGWRFVLSFAKSNWRLADYPVLIRHQDSKSFSGPERLRPVPWIASIVNWHLLGSGDTRQAALDSLETNFANFRASANLCRDQALKFLSSSRQVTKFLNTLHSKTILYIAYSVSHGRSSLMSPACGTSTNSNQTMNSTAKSFRSIVDVADVPNANIAAILERIAISNPVTWT